MWEFEIFNTVTQETYIIHGYWLSDAFRRLRMDPTGWILIRQEYID